MNGTPMSDKDILDDVLSSQKAITVTYNTYTNECANPQVRDTFLNLLNDEHKLESDVFDELHKRGWQPTPQADQKRIQEANEKYQNAV